ncbi:MAG: cytosolic protein [Nanoarchaeota archaeon]|nr:cytosolic protein [Nanoarchaeota archaeon]
MECKKQENSSNCNCTYPCDKKGKCCGCLSYHLSRKELPACCFSNDIEKTYDRSFKKFAELVKENKI